MKNLTKVNHLQFAVVREDPAIELEVFETFNVQKPVFIASGGCTALCIAEAYPKLELVLIEPNLSQIQLIKKKIKIILSKNQKSIKSHFCIGKDYINSNSLIESGNFESLFRHFRLFLYEFVLGENQFRQLFKKNRQSLWENVFRHPYWSVAFELFFSDAILRTMFGDAAIQHAPKGSYPWHFRKRIEQGLLRSDAAKNYFLHHIFLGYYLEDKDAVPSYLKKYPKNVNVKFINSMAEQVDSYSSFDFVGLSNIFDWSSEKQVRFLAGRLSKELEPGSVVMFRQLNNSNNFNDCFGKGFVWQKTLANKLYRKDRSLFYTSLHIGVKK